MTESNSIENASDKTALDNTTTYRSPVVLSLMAMAGIGGFSLCEIASVGFGIAQVSDPTRTVALTPDKADSLWTVCQAFVVVFQFPLYIFSAVAFLMWLFRLYKNLPALRSTAAKYTPGWAVGWWFVPVANLFMPFLVVRYVWNESDPSYDADLGLFTSTKASAPFFMSAWWAFWLITNLFANITAQLFDSPDKQLTEMSGYGFILGGVFWLVAAGFAFKLLLDITGRQELRHRNLARVSLHSPPPPPNFDEEQVDD